MQRKLQLVVIIFVILAMVLLLGMIMYMQLHENSAPSNLRGDLHSAVTKPVDFVKSRVTGGVGVQFFVSSGSLPQIVEVITNSPAAIAGLRSNDFLVAIDAKPTMGMKMAEVANAIRGFTGGNVMLTVKRPGISTNLTFIIRRESWNAMGLQSPSTSATNVVPFPFMGSNVTVFAVTNAPAILPNSSSFTFDPATNRAPFAIPGGTNRVTNEFSPFGTGDLNPRKNSPPAPPP